MKMFNLQWCWKCQNRHVGFQSNCSCQEDDKSFLNCLIPMMILVSTTLEDLSLELPFMILPCQRWWSLHVQPLVEMMILLIQPERKWLPRDRLGSVRKWSIHHSLASSSSSSSSSCPPCHYHHHQPLNSFMASIQSKRKTDNTSLIWKKMLAEQN